MFHFGLMLKDYLDYYKISYSDFADRLGISQKHMMEIIYGSTNISTELMIAISLLTDIDVNLIASIEYEKKIYDNLLAKYGNDKNIGAFLSNFCIKELESKEWVNFLDFSSVSSNAVDLLKFMKTNNFDNCSNYLEKRVAFKKLEGADLIKAFLWIRRCENLTEDVEVCEYSSKKLDELFCELNKESFNKFNVESISNILAKYGIVLCVEEPLKGTKVRGASLVKKTTPHIFLTTYYKEKSSFYFALYHEIAHIKRDFNMLKSKMYIDTNDNEIDEYALNKMIPLKVWDKIKEEYKNGEREFDNYDICKSFIYSRLAYEGIIKYSSRLYQSNREKIN